MPANGQPNHLGDFTLRPRVLLITLFALVIGVFAGIAADLLQKLIGLITNLVFYQRLDTGMVAPGAEHHPWWLVLLAPVLGGLIVGLMARYGSERIRGHGMPETIEAILVGGSRVRPRVAALKPASAAVTIGTGGPFGAEGPIIMTGGALGSIVAQTLRLSAGERKTLLVAGAAGGMAATFNSPLAAVLLAVELLLFEWRPRSLIPVSAAVVSSTIVRTFLIGGGALFPVAAPSTPGVSDTLTALLPGLTGGLLAVVATSLVYFSEDLFQKLPIHWMWWPAIGGLVIGIGGLVEPRALGIGYDVINQLLTGQATLGLIVGILVVKTLIWGLSLGSGTSGGVLAPTFMIGAVLGGLEGAALPHAAPGFWAMCGLAAVLGGVMRSPLTGIVFTLEITHAWNNLLPVAVAALSAYALSVLLLKRSVLTEKIARRQVHLTREYTTDPLETCFTREIMSDPCSLGVRESATSAQRSTVPGTVYPVLDEHGRFAGIVTQRSLAGPGDTVGDLVRRPRTVVFGDMTLREVANAFAHQEVTSAPVVDREDPQRVVGVVDLADLLHARRRVLHEEHHREKMLPLGGRDSEPTEQAQTPG